MIILLSPAKTFAKVQMPYETRPIFEDKAFELIEQLKRVSVANIEKQMKLSHTYAMKVHDDYQHFNTKPTCAIFAYDGYAFKSFNVHDLHAHDLLYMKTHLYIISALYGLVRPFDGISHYRLEMQDQSLGNLYHFWRHDLSCHFQTHHQHDLIINLASKEYAKALDSTLHILTIQFYQSVHGKDKAISMEVKKMRGLMARYLIQHQINDQEDLKNIVIEDYHYDPLRSSALVYTFIKEGR